MANRIGDSRADPFFLQPKTLAALERLSECDELVIYCGAGVTIDQTGVSWMELIRKILELASVPKHGPTPDRNLERRLKSLEFLLSKIADPRQAASLVAEQFAHPGATENEFLTSKLHTLLYAHRSWSTGLILRNIARLAVLAALFERKVTIVTTNYDSFIEDAIEKRLGDLVSDGGLRPGWEPGRFRTTLTKGVRAQRKLIAPARGGASNIEILYLHGRVDPHNGATEGDLVLTEASFARTRDQSLKALAKVLKSRGTAKKHGLLVVGASLNDGPLIEALALAATPDQLDEPKDQRFRMALVDNPVSKEAMQSEFKSAKSKSLAIDADDVLSALALRGKHLGLEIHWPASHSQSAQFFEELRVSISARERFGPDHSYQSVKLGVSYGARLDRWWAAFGSSRPAGDPGYVHAQLRFVKTALAQILERQEHPLLTEENLRLELWARIRPSKTNRILTLIGNSSGPFVEERTRRTERLFSGTTASVHAYAEGRPLLSSVDEFGPSASVPHWQTFFSVPIFVHVEAKTKGGGLIPVGVITLASNLPKEAAEAKDSSVLGKISTEMAEEMKVLIIYAGRILLDPALAEVASNLGDPPTLRETTRSELEALMQTARDVADVTNTRERQAVNESAVRDLEAWRQRQR